MSNYRGQPSAGGSLGVGITIDPSPLQRLATFTYYRDRDFWLKKQRDDAIAAERIAQIAAYDTRSPFKQYTDDLTREVNELYDKLRNDPSIVTYDRNNPQKWLDFEQQRGRIENKRKRATGNDALYNAAKSKIELIPDKQNREDHLELLKIKADKLFLNGVEQAYNQQFEASPELKPQDYIIPDVPLTEDYTITRKPNDIEITGLKYIDIGRIKPAADAIYFGLSQPLNEDTPEFNQLSDAEKKAARLENRITSRTRTNLDNIANSVNGLVDQFKEQYKKINPDAKVADIPDDVLAENGSVGSVISLAKSYNEIIDRINSATGNRYPHINLDDGATPTELIELQTFAKNKDAFISEIKPTIVETDDELDRQRLALGWFNARTGRIQEERLADAAGVSKDMATSAKAYAEALFNKMKSLANADGIIPKANLSKLTTDEVKYLGSGTTTENKFTLEPLNLAGVSSILIDPDGTIKTFIGGTGKSLGTQRGQPINISTIATNKLGDEMTVTAGKEGYNFNNLIPLYQSGSTDVQKQFTDQTTTIETELSVEPADWKQEGKNWRYKDGRLFDSKGKEIKKK